MLRVILRSVAGLLLLASCAALAAAADEKAEKSKRLAYVVKYGSAKDLAKVLGEHLKGAAEVEALPEASANLLLIRSTPGAFNEVVKLLEVLDRRPRMVAVEVWVAEVLPGEKKDEPLDTKALSGPADAVLAKVEALRRKGYLGAFQQLEVTTAENQFARARSGVTQPVVIGLHVTGTGVISRNIMYRPYGTDARVTPRVGPDNLVALEVLVVTSRPHIGTDAPLLGTDEKKAPVRAAETVQASVEAKVSVPPGQAVVVGGVKTTAKDTQPPPLVIVTARVLDGTEKAKEEPRGRRVPRRPR